MKINSLLIRVSATDPADTLMFCWITFTPSSHHNSNHPQAIKRPLKLLQVYPHNHPRIKGRRREKWLIIPVFLKHYSCILPHFIVLPHALFPICSDFKVDCFPISESMIFSFIEKWATPRIMVITVLTNLQSQCLQEMHLRKDLISV